LLAEFLLCRAAEDYFASVNAPPQFLDVWFQFNQLLGDADYAIPYKYSETLRVNLGGVTERQGTLFLNSR
jgi:hypothetical protein